MRIRSGASAGRHLDPLLAVHRDEDLEPLPLEVPRQPVPVLLVVLDQQELGHRCGLSSRSVPAGGSLAISPGRDSPRGHHRA